MPAAKEPTWAVVVIHGVGNTEPGQTLETVFAEAIKSEDKNGLAWTDMSPAEVRYLYAKREDPAPIPPTFGTPLTPNPNDTKPEQRFPMHLREVQLAQPPEGTPEKAIFAEVYWADISASGHGVMNLLRQWFTIIFHMRFLAEEGADFVARSARWLRPTLYVTSWFLCGPIAALSLVILYMSVVHGITSGFLPWLVGRLGGTLNPAHWRLVIVIAAAVGIYLSSHWIGKTKGWGSPWQMVFGFAAIWCVVIGLAASFALPDLLNHKFANYHGYALWAEPDPISAHIAWLLLALTSLFFVVGFFAVISFVLWLNAIIWTWAEGASFRSLFTALGALLLQIDLWVLLVPAVGTYAMHLFDQRLLDTPEAPFPGILQVLLWHVSLALVVAVVVLGVWLVRMLAAMRARCMLRKEHGDGPKADGISSPETYEIPRLIINPCIFAALILLSFFGILVYLYDGTCFSLHLLGFMAKRDPTFKSILEQVFLYKVLIIVATPSIIVPFIGTSWYFLPKGLAAGGHVLMDIVSHFYSKSTAFPSPWRKYEQRQIENFLVEMQIEARFIRVLQEVKNMGNVRHLTVISHSQGTMIAVNVLHYDWTAQLLGTVDVRLVTMGSPIYHLYQYHTPYRYPPFFNRDGAFNGGDQGWGLLFPTVGLWLNIYRLDDFIGTYIKGGENVVSPLWGDKMDWPKNIPIAEAGHNGHSGYWNQPHVWKVIRRHLPGPGAVYSPVVRVDGAQESLAAPRSEK